MRRSLGPGMSANSIPAISRVAGAIAVGIATGVGAAIPGGPPPAPVGVGVGRPGSRVEVGSVIGSDEGSSLAKAAGPHATTERRSAARRRGVTREAYRGGGHVVRILPSSGRTDTKFVEVHACHHAV